MGLMGEYGTPAWLVRKREKKTKENFLPREKINKPKAKTQTHRQPHLIFYRTQRKNFLPKQDINRNDKL